MNEMPATPEIARGDNESTRARTRMLADPGEPCLLADWIDVLMCHLEVDPEPLKLATPFPLDLLNGRAFVSLVFFLLRRMRPRIGGPWTEWMFAPIATHPFLNVRTYVQLDGEPGIYFLAEWLPNALSVQLGPRFFGLPYRLGQITRFDRPECGQLQGEVRGRGNDRIQYAGEVKTPTAYAPCPHGSADEWLMERYTAFTKGGPGSRPGYFRIWHPPWPQAPADVRLLDDSLLRRSWPWMADATWAGANCSPGFHDVWMGRPHRLFKA